MSPRLPPLPPEQRSPAQTEVAQAIIAGPRGSLGGPFQAWLRSPVLAERLQTLGEYVRFDNVLPRRLSEFAILITARHWTAQFEWYAHHKLALAAGLDPALDLVSLFQLAEFRGDKAEHQLLFAFGKIPQRLETAGAVGVVFEEIAVEIGLAEKLFGDELVTARRDEGRTEISAA